MTTFKKSNVSTHGGSPAEAAADWLVLHDRGDLSPEEKRQFEDWLAIPANAQAFNRARRTWAIFDGAADDTHIRALRKAARDAEDASRGWRIRMAMFGAAAACLAVILVGAVLVGPGALQNTLVAYDDVSGGHSANRPIVADSRSYSTQKGERLNITLADGSAVTLNTDTELNVQFSRDQRRVDLVRGQAFFEVAKNPQRPFVVVAADRRVVALGTQFDVHLAPSHLQVLLVEGRVAVQREHTIPSERGSDSREVILHPGQKLTASLGVAEEVSEVDVDRQMMWRKGFVEFDDVLLEAAVAEMNRYSRDSVVISDPRVASLRVSGVFRTGQLDRFLEIVSELLPVEPVRVERDTAKEIELRWSGT